MVEQAERKALIVVGLGNPGREYQRTRHNIGFMVVQAFAQSKGLALREDSRWPGIMAKGMSKETELHLLLPTTYMNESGRAVQRYLAYYKMAPAGLLVIADDVALDFGVLRLRPGGGTGGHNGLKSIQAHLSTSEFGRLRMGIGDRLHGELADYVLAEFSKEEQEGLADVIHRGVAVIEDLLASDFQSVMKRVNTREKASKDDPEDRQEKSDKSAQEN